MKLQLSKPFAGNSPADEYDVHQVKRVLNRLGYYTPPKNSGMTSIPDREMFIALQKFQKAQKLTATGTMKPGDDTEKALNGAQEKQGGSYIWRTMGDDKVRPEHAPREGQEFSWDSPPEGGNPGEDYNCRCWAKDVEKEAGQDINDPPLKPVYLELWVFPLFGLGRIGILWKIWNRGQEIEWKLTDKKSAKKWENQFKNRNWTPEQITETIKNGKRYPAPNNVNKGNPAIRYEYKGRYVVRDEITKEILQISEPDFIRPIVKE